ncbi:hypothetical protein [Leptospira santarosai]|uniref:hypothetical protein n=1 Tax=Leptospira santarosai TaxID=28183 RepID=UPI000A6B269B|nr:hypothetical protein [Leptospira santarosai]
MIVLGQALSSQGAIQESIQYLKYAIDRGFTDWNRIESDPLLEKLRRSKEWEGAKISLKQKLLIPLESNVVGVITDLGPNTIVVYLICPNRKLVTFSEGDYDIEKKLYFGKWSLNQNRLELVTEKKCFAEGQGKAVVNHNDQPTYKSYRYVGCKTKDKKNSDLASTDFTLSKSSFAALFRQYYGEEFEVDGIGYRYHKFTNGFPIQCKDNFIPKSVKDLELETRQYLKAY